MVACSHNSSSCEAEAGVLFSSLRVVWMIQRVTEQLGLQCDTKEQKQRITQKREECIFCEIIGSKPHSLVSTSVGHLVTAAS